MMSSNRFTKSITHPDDVQLITIFVDFLYNLDIIDEETVEDYENHLHDELEICPECSEFADQCSCYEGRGMEYDDEASFE